MKCKSCGMLVEKKWKYCPYCSKKIKGNKKIFILFLLVFIFNLGIDIKFITDNILPVNESYIKKSLSKKYKEEFNNIYYITSIKNPDGDFSCDGSSFGTIKDSGSTKYYKVYSKKNNFEFYAYYSTSDILKIIYDTYNAYFNRKKNILEIYDFIKNNFNNIVFLISYDDEETVEITSKRHLEDILSNLNDDDISSDNLDTFSENVYVVINENIFEFSKDNYPIIKELSNKVAKFKSEYSFSVFLLFDNDVKIELGGLNGEPYVYDEFNINNASGERFDDFMLRTEY